MARSLGCGQECPRAGLFCSRRQQSLNDKQYADGSKSKANEPKGLPSGQNRDCSDGNRDLKHGHTARQNMVRVQEMLGFRSEFLSFFLDLLLVMRILRRFALVRRGGRPSESVEKFHFAFQLRFFDALGLEIAPLVRRFDLAGHSFGRVMAGAHGGDGSQTGQQGGAERHAESPPLAMRSPMMDFFMEMFRWDFRVFHVISRHRRWWKFGAE